MFFCRLGHAGQASTCERASPGNRNGLERFTETSAPEVYRHAGQPQPEAARDSEISQHDHPPAASIGQGASRRQQLPSAQPRTWEMLWGAVRT